MTPTRGKVLGRILVAVAAVALAAVVFLVLTRASVDPDLLYEQALAEVEAGRVREAEATLDRLRSLRTPTVLDTGLRARAAIAMKRDDEAIRLLGEIPSDHPLGGWSRLRIGQLHRSHHRLRSAETGLRESLRLQPEQVEAHRELIYILGLQLRRRELNEEFRAVASRSLLTPREAWVWCMVRDLAWWTPEEHAPLLRKAVDADPGDVWSILALAEVERRQGHYDEAEKLLGRNPNDHGPTTAARAEIVLQKKGADEALAVMDAAPDPRDHAFDAARGRIALSRRDGKAAVAYLTEADRAEPGRRGIVSDLGKAYLAAGDPARAKPLLDRAGRIDALNDLLLKSEGKFDRPEPDRWRALATACEEAGRFHEAKAWLNLLLKLDPLDSEIQGRLYRVDHRIESERIVD